MNNPIRAAVYIRMSSDKQEDSPERQRSQTRPYTERKGYTVVREYLDEGISGDQFQKRKGLQQLLADAASGLFSVLVVDEPSRLSRQEPIEFIATVIKPLKDAGVRLDTVSNGEQPWDNLAGILMTVIHSDQASGEQLKISRRALSGMLKNALEGRHCGGGPPYGYLIEYETIEEEGRPPKTRPVKLVPDPRRAHVVKWIFERYAEGRVTMDEIARELNERGAPPPAGKGGREARGGRIVRWNRGGVRAILSNPRYVGVQTWNRRTRGRFYHLQKGAVERKQKQTYQLNDRGEWYVVPDRHEPLISQELFDRVQTRMDWNKGGRKPSSRGGYLFSGLAVCGKCGRTLAGIHRNGHNFYRCQRYNEVGEVVCGYGSIREDVLIEQLLGCIQEQMLAPERLAELRKHIRREAERQRAPDKLKALRKQLSELEANITRGNENLLLLPADRVPKSLAVLKQWEQDRDQLQDKLNRLTGRGDEMDLEKQIEMAEAMLWKLKKASDKDDPLLLRQVVREAVARIEVSFLERRTAQRTRHIPTGGTIHLRPQAIHPALHASRSS